MKCFAKKSALIMYVFLTIHGSHAQNIPTELDKLFHQVSTDPEIRFNGVVLVAENDKIIYQNAVGFSNISTEKKNTIHTRFQLASLSKVFTATAIMQLVEKGTIQLDDPLTKYFPSFPYGEITIRQILSHTSGLPDFREVYREKSSSCTPQFRYDTCTRSVWTAGIRTGNGLALFQHGLRTARESG